MTVWEMKVRWSGSAVELQHLQQRIELPLVDRNGFSHILIEGFGWGHDPGTVQKEAEELLRCLNGALILEGIEGSFRSEKLRRNEPNGKSTHFIFAEGVCHVRVFASASIQCYDKDGNLIPEPESHPKRIIDGLTSDEGIRGVLAFLSELRQDDWVTLYKLVEIIFKSGAPTKEWGMKNALDKVKSVANNPVALGRKARHAVPSGSDSKARMTFDQAKTVLVGAVRKWIEYRKAEALR